MTTFGPAVLDLDLAAEAARVVDALRRQVGALNRRGLVLGLSGGIDSAVCAALAARAVGPERTLALLMPDRDTPPEATARATAYGERLGVELITEDIDAALDRLGCFRRRDEAVRRVFPEIRPGYRAKIAVAGELLDRDRVSYFHLVVDEGDGTEVSRRMPADAYLEVVAATNMKQRVRKLVEYTHAESRNAAVLGTPNRLEHDLGFFVRGGDGLADVKPIAHLYKTQVIALAGHLGVDEAIRRAVPSTDTYSLPQTQEEFYFGMTLGQVDLLLYAHRHAIPTDRVASGMGLSVDQVERALRDIAAKERRAARASAPALVIHADRAAGDDGADAP